MDCNTILTSIFCLKSAAIANLVSTLDSGDLLKLSRICLAILKCIRLKEDICDAKIDLVCTFKQETVDIALGSGFTGEFSFPDMVKLTELLWKTIQHLIGLLSRREVIEENLYLFILGDNQLLSELIAGCSNSYRFRMILLSIPHCGTVSSRSCCSLHYEIVHKILESSLLFGLIFEQPGVSSSDLESWIRLVHRYRKCLFQKALPLDRVVKHLQRSSVSERTFRLVIDVLCTFMEGSASTSTMNEEQVIELFASLVASNGKYDIEDRSIKKLLFIGGRINLTERIHDSCVEILLDSVSGNLTPTDLKSFMRLVSSHQNSLLRSSVRDKLVSQMVGLKDTAVNALFCDFFGSKLYCFKDQLVHLFNLYVSMKDFKSLETCFTSICRFPELRSSMENWVKLNLPHLLDFQCPESMRVLSSIVQFFDFDLEMILGSLQRSDCAGVEILCLSAHILKRYPTCTEQMLPIFLPRFKKAVTAEELRLALEGATLLSDGCQGKELRQAFMSCFKVDGAFRNLSRHSLLDLSPAVIKLLKLVDPDYKEVRSVAKGFMDGLHESNADNLCNRKANEYIEAYTFAATRLRFNEDHCKLDVSAQFVNLLALIRTNGPTLQIFDLALKLFCNGVVSQNTDSEPSPNFVDLSDRIDHGSVMMIELIPGETIRCDLDFWPVLKYMHALSGNGNDSVSSRIDLGDILDRRSITLLSDLLRAEDAQQFLRSFSYSQIVKALWLVKLFGTQPLSLELQNGLMRIMNELDNNTLLYKDQVDLSRTSAKPWSILEELLQYPESYIRSFMPESFEWAVRTCCDQALLCLRSKAFIDFVKGLTEDEIRLIQYYSFEKYPDSVLQAINRE